MKNHPLLRASTQTKKLDSRIIDGEEIKEMSMENKKRPMTHRIKV
jgi:hypothetical protein